MEMNGVLQIKRGVSQSAVGTSQLIHKQRDDPPLSSGLICISKRHIYIQREYEVVFCFSPVLTFNSKDSGREGGGRPHSRLSAFRRAAIVKKNETRFYCDDGNVDWKSGFRIGLHIISGAIKLRSAATGENKSRSFLCLLERGGENAVILM